MPSKQRSFKMKEERKSYIFLHFNSRYSSPAVHFVGHDYFACMSQFDRIRLSDSPCSKWAWWQAGIVELGSPTAIDIQQKVTLILLVRGSNPRHVSLSWVSCDFKSLQTCWKGLVSYRLLLKEYTCRFWCDLRSWSWTNQRYLHWWHVACLLPSFAALVWVFPSSHLTNLYIVHNKTFIEAQPDLPRDIVIATSSPHKQTHRRPTSDPSLEFK